MRLVLYLPFLKVVIGEGYRLVTKLDYYDSSIDFTEGEDPKQKSIPLTLFSFIADDRNRLKMIKMCFEESLAPFYNKTFRVSLETCEKTPKGNMKYLVAEGLEYFKSHLMNACLRPRENKNENSYLVGLESDKEFDADLNIERLILYYDKEIEYEQEENKEEFEELNSIAYSKIALIGRKRKLVKEERKILIKDEKLKGNSNSTPSSKSPFRSKAIKLCTIEIKRLGEEMEDIIKERRRGKICRCKENDENDFEPVASIFGEIENEKGRDGRGTKYHLNKSGNRIYKLE